MFHNVDKLINHTQLQSRINKCVHLADIKFNLRKNKETVELADLLFEV